ncbi:MAG: hypothetical protein HON70_12830, partial [Lentisphaerae bacterium]|nr:hypothetical protein [Lentisphaerota bacterium]
MVRTVCQGTWLLLALCLTHVCGAVEEGTVADVSALGGEGVIARATSDALAVQRYRRGIQGILLFMESRPGLFPKEPDHVAPLLTREQREAVRALWGRLFDYYLGLDAIGRFHGRFHALGEKEQRQAAFVVAYAAFLAQYRFALDFIDRASPNPSLDTLLNEAIPHLGLPGKTYARFKFRYLNVARATEFVALKATAKVLGAARVASPLQQGMAEDSAFIWQMGRGQGHVLTGKNAIDIVKGLGFTAWLPVQTGVAEWMGDTKVWRSGRSLITAEQTHRALALLEPGDVLFERREWHLSNIGIPGFWTHMALYIGTPDQRRAFFDTPGVRDWLTRQEGEDATVDELLQRSFPEAYATLLTPFDDGHQRRVIEAISPGVTFTSFEKTAHADSLAVLRPRLDRVAKAVALVRAFGYAGRPYDYNFDFRTDAALVCSELVFKCYEKGDGSPGLCLPTELVAGRPVTPPNAVVREYGGTDAITSQFDFVLFLD